MTLLGWQRERLRTVVVLLALAGSVICRAGQRPVIETIRVPGDGVQPQVATDQKGVVHLIYLAGPAAHSDVYYTRSVDDGSHFSRPLRVNSVAGSAIAIG